MATEEERFCAGSGCYHGESFHDGIEGECSAPGCECPGFVE